MAASIVESHVKRGPVGVVVLTCTAEADGSFPATALATKISGRLLALETNPGGTAPQADYDVALTDGEGHDVLQGVGGNRHTSNTEKVAIVYSGTAIHPPVAKYDTLTLAITGNNVNGAITVVKLYYEGEGKAA